MQVNEQTAAFRKDVGEQVRRNGTSDSFLQASRNWMLESTIHRYSYCFSWLGRPIIQYPQDIVAMQEIVWDVRPDLIIETGIAHGGSLILSASLLALLDYSDAARVGQPLDPRRSPWHVQLRLNHTKFVLQITVPIDMRHCCIAKVVV